MFLYAHGPFADLMGLAVREFPQPEPSRTARPPSKAAWLVIYVEAFAAPFKVGPGRIVDWT